MNHEVDYLRTSVGLHMAQKNNVITIYLHSFQFFYDSI